MNDRELDEILNQWAVPPVPASLRGKVLAGFVARTKPATSGRGRLSFIPEWFPGLAKGLAGIAVASVACFLVVVAAFPQMSFLSPFVPIRFTVDAEFIKYAADGSSRIVMQRRSFQHNGREIVLASSFPDAPFETAVRRLLDPVNFTWYQLTGAQLGDNGREIIWPTWTREEDGCLFPGMTVRPLIPGHETVLNYAVARFVTPLGKGRATQWLAPELDCFRLRETVEMPSPDGSFRLVSEQRALQVTVVSRSSSR